MAVQRSKFVEREGLANPFDDHDSWCQGCVVLGPEPTAPHLARRLLLGKVPCTVSLIGVGCMNHPRSTGVYTIRRVSQSPYRKVWDIQVILPSTPGTSKWFLPQDATYQPYIDLPRSTGRGVLSCSTASLIPPSPDHPSPSSACPSFRTCISSTHLRPHSSPLGAPPVPCLSS